MAEEHYFQVSGFRYITDLFSVKKLGVAFEFDIIPDGQIGETFSTKVIFTTVLLYELGKTVLTGGAFLKKQDRPRFERHAFHLLKTQLEASSLKTHDDITVHSKSAEQLRSELPKQCEYLALVDKKWHCLEDDHSCEIPTMTSLKVCASCDFPEPLYRCDNLLLCKTTSSIDSQGILSRMPTCVCLNKHTIPSDLNSCIELECFVPYKFYLEKPKQRLSFQTPR